MDIRFATYEESCFCDDFFDFGFFGRVIDDRTKFSTEEVRRLTKESDSFSYCKDSFLVEFGDSFIELQDIMDYFSRRIESGRVVVDATSLDIPELILIFDFLYEVGFSEFHILYVEPFEYNRGSADSDVGYSLSDNILGFEDAGLPGFSSAVDFSEESLFVVFSGFELSRLLSAFENYDMNDRNARVVLGVPGFNFGWENKAFSSNVKALCDNNMKDAIVFSPAGSPFSAYSVVSSLKESLRKSNVFILPLGTKPCSVGAIIYAVSNKGSSSILFDWPIRKTGRTSGVGGKYLYRCLNAVSSDSI